MITLSGDGFSKKPDRKKKNVSISTPLQVDNYKKKHARSFIPLMNKDSDGTN